MSTHHPRRGRRLADSYPVGKALSIVVNEEWPHRPFAEQDLAALASR